MTKIVLLISLALAMVSCQPIENSARDSAAALGGAIVAAQAQYQTQCAGGTTNGLPVCTLINRAVDGQNALVTATEAYCGWSQAAPPPSPTTKCVAVANAKDALQTAINNANTFVTQLKGVIK
jgi:hypothetical protein